MSVAEVALALTCACAKNLVEVTRQIRAGTALNKKYKCLYSAGLLTGKTFGILGGGAIGQLTAKKLYVLAVMLPSFPFLSILFCVSRYLMDGRIAEVKFWAVSARLTERL